MDEQSKRDVSPHRPGANGRAGDRAVSILRELDTHKTDEPEVASMASRVVARVIDLILVFGALFAGAFALALVRRVVNGSKEWADPVGRTHISPLLYVLSAIALLVGLVAYDVIATSVWGQTVGNRLIGIKLAAEDGWTKPNRRALLTRTVLWAVPFGLIVTLPARPVLAAIVLVAIIAAVVALARDGERRGYWDRIAGTRIVRPR